MLLVTKYAPQKIADVLGNNDIVNILKTMRDDFPHLLLTGPPGTGKTSIAHILKKDFLVLELNASDDRGIEIIRTKIKEFCYKKGENKLVILDECDNLTSGAQQSLRRLMEATNTKFILICNRVSEVIEPIQSRCAVIRFNRITREEVEWRIKEICKMEDIKLTRGGFDGLMLLSNGDIRKCLNCLEALRNMNEMVDEDFLYKINGIPNFEKLEKILEYLRVKDVLGCLEEFEDLWEEKYENIDLMDGFFKVAKGLENYDVLKIIGKYHTRVIEGTSSKVQFYGMFNEIMKVY